MSWLYLAFLFY